MMIRGKMIPEELEKLVIKHKEEGHLPFFVNCTTGTTVYGAYDPISEIAGESQSHCHHFVFRFCFCFHSLLIWVPPAGLLSLSSSDQSGNISVLNSCGNIRSWMNLGDIYSHCTFLFDL